jgi:hypothetical protein
MVPGAIRVKKTPQRLLILRDHRSDLLVGRQQSRFEGPVSRQLCPTRDMEWNDGARRQGRPSVGRGECVVGARDPEALIADRQCQPAGERGPGAGGGGFGDFTGGLYLRKTQIAQIGPELKNSAPERTAPKAKREIPPSLQIERERLVTDLNQQAGPDLIHHPLQQLIIGRYELGQLPQPLANTGGYFFQLGQYLVAQAVAKEGAVQVGAVKAGPEMMLTAIGLDGSAGDPKQRADKHQRGLDQDGGWHHTAQPGKARPAQEMHEDGLGLVIGIMTDCHDIGTDLVSYLGQKVVTSLTGRFLLAQLELGCEHVDVDLPNSARQPPGCSELTDKDSVCVRLGTAQPMIKVRNVQSYVEFFAERKQDVEKADGVRATGDSNDDQIVRMKQVVSHYSLSDSG